MRLVGQSADALLVSALQNTFGFPTYTTTMGDMYNQGYSFMPAAGQMQQPQMLGTAWQPAQVALPQNDAAPPPLPAELPPPLPDCSQPAVQQQAGQQGMQAWGQAPLQQPQQGWDQQQGVGMGQQWQPQQMQQWQPQDQQQQWQAHLAQRQQEWQGQEQWQAQQQPQQQWQQSQQPPQPKPSGKGDWRELWRQQLQQQQLQQQQQQQQWAQGMGMQQWAQGMPGQQPYGMYNQQQYGYNQQQQGMMQQQGNMYNQYGQAPMQQPPGVPPGVQPAWDGNMYQQQQQSSMGQQGGYGTAPLHIMHQQGPAAPAPPDSSAPAGLPGADCSMGGMGMPPMQPAPQAAPTPAAAPARPPSPPKPLDLAHMLLPPGRDSRPKRLLLLLRGPPGCGKSHLARTIRQMEVSAGGQAPRVHSIDDYFMVDVEQDGDEGAGSKRRGSAAVTVQEYQYDAALEPSYWKSLLRAAGKTLGDGHHPMVLLDAPALKAEQVREVWKVVQGAGAELLVVNALTTDPEVCFKQNTHKHSLDFIKAQAKLYEVAPATFTCADASSLFEDKRKKSAAEGSPSKAGASSSTTAPAPAGISEVDMAIDDDSAAAAADILGPDSSIEPAAALGTPSGRSSPKSSRWEDDSDTEDHPADGPAARGSGSPVGQGVKGDSRMGDMLSGSAVGANGDSTAADRPKKKARLAEGLALDAFDAESLLAGVNQELELLDAADGSARTSAAAAGAGPGTAVVSAGRAGSGPLGLGAGNSSGSSGGRNGILKKHGTPSSRCKKVRVRWPDLSDQEAQTGFRIAAPGRPLAEVFWVEGLGPSKELWMAEADGSTGTDLDGVDDHTHGPAAGAAGTHVRNSSFADQVRAEHRAEHDLFRAILLGHNSTPAGPSTAHKASAAGSAGAGGSQPRLFMLQKS